MTGPANCELCDEPLGDRGHDRIGGLALCRRCFLGDVQRVVQARGWTLWSEHAEYSPREMDESDMHYRTEVRITMPGETALKLVCQRRTWWRSLLGLVRSRARSGDPLAEAHMCMWTPSPTLVEGFLRGEGVEGCLMEVLGIILTSRVEIRGGSVMVMYVADDPHTEGELVARACVLAHHVARHAGQPIAARAEERAASVYGAPPRRG